MLLFLLKGVTRSFYSRFATFVAHETGWPVLTYDYRGNVGFLPDAERKQLPKHPLVDIDADISDWAHLDQPAALEYLLAHLRGLPTEEERTVSGEGLLRGSCFCSEGLCGKLSELITGWRPLSMVSERVCGMHRMKADPFSGHTSRLK
jgi:hypothetical protein